MHKYVDTRYVRRLSNSYSTVLGFIYIVMLCVVIGWHLKLRVWKDTTYLP